MSHKLRYVLLAIALCLLAPVAANADDLSNDQKSLIVQNCSSIKIQLKKVQRNDVKNRVYLGSQYETISTNLMTNLNARIINNGISDTDFANQQANFLNDRARFKKDYISYSQELEKLIDMKCTEDAQGFYDQLETVRGKRRTLSDSISRMKDDIEEHRGSIEAYIDELKEGDEE